MFDDENVSQEEMQSDPECYGVKLPKTDKVALDFPTFTDYLDYLNELDKTDPLEHASRIGLNLKHQLDLYDKQQKAKNEARESLRQVMAEMKAEALREAKAATARKDEEARNDAAMKYQAANLGEAATRAEINGNTRSLTTPQGLAAYMSDATSEADYSRRIDDVKRANGGDYPNFWFATMIISGLAQRISAKW